MSCCEQLRGEGVRRAEPGRGEAALPRAYSYTFRCSRTCTDLELVRPFPVCVNRAGRASRVVHILCDDDTGLRLPRAWHKRAACTRAATRDPNMAGQRRVRPGETRWSQTVQQCRLPKVRSLGKPLGHVVDELVERVRHCSDTCRQAALPSQIGSYGSSVMGGAAEDLYDRHSLSFECVNIHVVLLVTAKESLSRAGSGSKVISIDIGPFVRTKSTRTGEFQRAELRNFSESGQ